MKKIKGILETRLDKPMPYSERVYTKENIQEILDKTSFPIYCSNEGVVYGNDVPLQDISHTVDSMEIEDDALTAEITILDTPKGKIMKDVLDSGLGSSFMFDLCSIGTVDENKIVKVEEIFNVRFVPKLESDKDGNTND